MRRAIRIFCREMKRLILTACLACCGVLSLAQAAESDFFIEGRETGSAADQASSPGSSNRSTDSGDQDSGILRGGPVVRLDSRYGDISVETIFGKVNGAQVRVTW
jgi:hypothetical protein